MQKVDVWFIRHGETDWNAEKRLQGHTDIPLNSNGEAQAMALQPWFRKLNPQAIFVSDLSRALKTAEIANKNLGLELSIHVELRESLLGEVEGQTIDEVIAKYGEASWKRWHSNDPDFTFLGGETPLLTLKRIKTFLAAKFADQPNLSRVAIVTHGGVVKRIVSHATGAPSPLPFFFNCSITHLKYSRELDHWTFIGPVD
jgi:broad specificity phosphatase PhoE